MNFKRLASLIMSVLIFLSFPCITVSAKEEYTITTATDIQKHLAKLITLTEEKQREYDFNNDGILSIIDSTYLRYMLADIEINPAPDTQPTSSTPDEIPKPTTTEPPESTTEMPTTEATEATTEAPTTEAPTVIYPTTIDLDISTIKLGAGDSYTLQKKTDMPEYPFLFTSSNIDVATVDTGGKITAVSVGTAEIICSAENGISASCSVTVMNAPTSVKLSVTSNELKVGQDFIISEHTNSGSYAYNFTWSSSNTKVATVTKTTGNQAKIQPKMQGTANITIKTYNGKTATCKVTVKGSVVKCLDVSEWQGNIDFNKVKSAGYNYVIIRAGYGRETYQKDECFEQNYKNAKSAGLKVGAYWYAYATSKAEAIIEAETCLYCIGNKTFDLPIYYDVEEQAMAKLSKTDLTNLIDGFCNKIESSGYQAGIYASNGMYWNIDKDKLKKNYSTWLSQIDGDFSGITDDVHQYTWSQKVNGITTNVDCNYIYNLNIVST